MLCLSIKIAKRLCWRSTLVVKCNEELRSSLNCIIEMLQGHIKIKLVNKVNGKSVCFVCILFFTLGQFHQYANVLRPYFTRVASILKYPAVRAVCDIARNSVRHGCQACAGCTHMDLNMAAKYRESVERNANVSSFC